MRKRTLNFTLDKILWFIIYIFPLLCYLLFLLHVNSADVVYNATLSHFFEMVLEITEIPFINTVFSWFNMNLPEYLYFPVKHWISGYISYFFTMQFLHIILDILLFMFKWVQKILEKVGVTGD